MYDEKTKKGYAPVELSSSNIGSDKARQIRAASQTSTASIYDVPREKSTLEPEIQRLIKLLYEEASYVTLLSFSLFYPLC